MNKLISYFNVNGDKITLPTKYVVCSQCDGEGKVVNPSLGAIPSHEFHENPDFEENYFGGVYDIDCPCCKGKRVELAINEDQCSQSQVDAYYSEMERIRIEDYNDRMTMWGECGRPMDC